jgi:hypothetical protein
MVRLTVYQDGRQISAFQGPYAQEKFNSLILQGVDITLTNVNQEEYRKHLIRSFHAALAKQGIIQYKPDIVGRYAVESTTELTIEQLKELVEEFSDGRRKFDDSRKRALRSELLVLLNKMGVYMTNGDWSLVNNFCMKHTGKLLYQMSEDELKKARAQFNSILDWYLKKQSETDHLKNLN